MQSLDQRHQLVALSASDASRLTHSRSLKHLPAPTATPTRTSNPLINYLASTHIREAKRELEMAIVMGGDKGLLRKSDCRSVKGDCRFTEPPTTSRRWYPLPST